MALVNLGGILEWPQLGLQIDATPAFTTTQYTIDAAGEIAAAVLRTSKAGDIDAILWRAGTTTTGGTAVVSVETIDASTGFPSGSLWGTTTNGTQVVLDADDGTLFTTALTLAATVAKGDLIGVCITAPALMAMQVVGFSTGHNALNFPYGALFTASWAKVAAVPIMAGLRYSDGTYAFVPNIPIISTLVNTAFGTGTNPNHRALRFKVTWPCRVRGCWIVTDADAAADILLVADNWDGTDGAALVTKVSLDSDIRRTTGFGAYKLEFSGTVTLLPNTIYRLVFKPTTASTVSLAQYTVGAVAQFDQNGGNQECYLSTANNPNDATDWTDTTTTRPFMGLLIDQIDNGVFF